MFSVRVANYERKYGTMHSAVPFSRLWHKCKVTFFRCTSILWTEAMLSPHLLTNFH